MRLFSSSLFNPTDMADRRTLTLCVTMILIASLFAGAGIYAYFSDTETSTGNVFIAGTIDLKTIDWDELTWRDGVTATWTATNMKPGDSFPFDVEFVGLSRAGSITPGSLEITCDYSVIEESPETEADTDPYTNLDPDKMAKQMIITRFKYAGVSYLDSIVDVDGDGKKTFYDLKYSPVTGLPIPTVDNGATFFRLSVKFSEDADNDFQGDTFNLTMIFTLKQ
ncbi:MAG: M73 family metallopeptidase [Candidatus Bathyarchaeota archaeon]|nr:M73 family metallopeptidase [Candidatus Bathyarchaeota archaeon]